MSKVILVSAMSKNRVIGRDGKLPWHISKDFKFFKSKTENSILVMGRRTYESLGKPLPNRINVVVTSQENYPTPEGVVVVESIDKAMEYANKNHPEITISVGGGSRIFEEALEKNLVDEMYLTFINKEYEGDTFFPKYDESKWKLESTEAHVREKDGLQYEFRKYVKSD